MIGPADPRALGVKRLRPAVEAVPATADNTRNASVLK